MLTSIFTKAIRDRWTAMTVATGLVALWLLIAMGIYRDIDISVYTELPQGIRELMGIPEGADAATLAYNVMLDFAAALTIAGMAISMGAAAIAGEERNGTIGLLLANPKTRSHVLASKLAALVTLVVAATLVLWGATEIAPGILDVDTGDTHLGAMALHLGANSLFYGTLALAIGAWTGNRTLASAIPAGVMVVSYFAVGLLPLVDPITWLAKAFPWYYFSGSEPLLNGIHWGHIAALTAVSLAFGAIAFIGVVRRDLRGRSVGTSILDRLRDNDQTARIFERLAGSTRVSRIWIKTTSEHQALLFVTTGVMFSLMGVLMGPMYVAIEDDIASAAEDFPEAILAIAGDGDLSTPEGWFTVETFSLMAPIAIMIVTIVIAAKALAGEEANRTMGLLLANPIRRSRIVYEKALAMAAYATAVGVSIFAGVASANLISSLDMSYTGIAAASLLATLLGLAFGTLALAIGAASGRTRIATYATIGVALTSHLLNSFLPLNDNLADWARLTPHHYFLSSDPLNNGMHWGHASLLATLTVTLLAAAVWSFDHRDLRQS